MPTMAGAISDDTVPAHLETSGNTNTIAPPGGDTKAYGLPVSPPARRSYAASPRGAASDTTA
jgi:hypothetical protein